MNRRLFLGCAAMALLLGTAGCAPLIVGAAVGGAGMYAASKDTVQGNTDKPYESLWSSAYTVAKIRGVIKYEDAEKGMITLQTDSGKVWIKLTRVTDATTQLQVAARKFHFPNLTLAEDLFVKIMEGVR